MKKNIPLKRRQGYHGFLKRYHNIYLFIAILISCGVSAGVIISNYIDVSDIKSLSSYLTTIGSGIDKYDCFMPRFFSSIAFIPFVFLLGAPLTGISIINFITFTKGMQIGSFCALFVYIYHLKGTTSIIMTLLPQMTMDLIATFLVSAGAIQLSMYIIYSTTNREQLNFEQLGNNVLNDVFICFVVILVGSYLRSTLVIEFIKLFDLIWSPAIIIETGGLQHGRLHVWLCQRDGYSSVSA